MRAERALRIDYEDEKGNASAREIWPVQIAFYENKQIIAAWCTLREAFRHFRTERIVGAQLADTRYGRRRVALADDWNVQLQEEQSRN